MDTHHPKIAASESDVSDNFYAASDILNVSGAKQNAESVNKVKRIDKRLFNETRKYYQPSS